MLPSPALRDPADSRPGWSQALRSLGPAVVLIAVALWEIASAARIAGRAATDDDWRAASEHVRRHQQVGELVVFAPGWIDPVGRRWLGDRVPIEMAARMDAARYAVVWEVALGDARAPEVAAIEPAARWRFGPLEVRRIEKAAAEVVTDFVAEAEAGRTEGARAPVSLEEVGLAPHRCIKLVPRPDGSLVVRFPEVELGEALVGHVGLADVFTRRDVRAPGRLHVAVDGDEVAAVEVGVDDGWVRWEAATRPGRATVVFQATAVGKEARDRRLCFAAEARR
jgi:hypothetical protein